MTERIHESSDFAGLSHFITSLTKRSKDPTSLTKEQTQRLKDLLIPLITQIISNINSNEQLNQDQTNLLFIFNAISLFLKQNPQSEFLSQIANLQKQISSMEQAALDDQQDIILTTENSLIGRIADKLETQKPISNEDELTDYIKIKTSKYNKLVSDLINKFDLPKTTKKNQVISQLEIQFNKQQPNKQKPQKQVTFNREITDSDLNKTFREELLKTADELLSVKNELDISKKKIDNKNEHIRRLQEERNLAQQQLKDAQAELKAIQNQEANNLLENRTEIDNNSDTLISAQIESIKADLLKAQMENEKKTRKLEKKRNYIKKVEEKMVADEEIINSLQHENKKLNEKIEKFANLTEAENLKHQMENNNFSDENAELKKKVQMKNQEIQKLQNLFDELTLQFDQQNNELAEISTGRIELVTYVQRLNEACKLLETHLEFANNRIRDISCNLEESLIKTEELERQQQQQLQQQQQQITHISVHQSLDLTFLDSIRQLSEESIPSSSKQINEIVNDSEVSVPQRIMQLFSFVIENLNKKCKSSLFSENGIDMDEDGADLQNSNVSQSEFQQMRKLASKFYSASLSELKFIQDLTNSRTIQTWVIGRNDEEIRFQLQTQCARLESFISENCEHLARDRSQPNLFDYLLVDSNHDPSTLSTNITEFIDRFKDPKTAEGKQLYLMLLQALTANDILQRYAIEARSQCNLQSKEIRQLRNLNEIAEREAILEENNNFNNNNNNNSNNNNNEYDDENVEEEVQEGKRRKKNSKRKKISKNTADIIEKVRTTIRNAIAGDKDLSELLTMLKCIDILDEESIDENKYARKIEKKLSQEISDSQETKSKLNNLANEANNELTNLKNEMNRLNNDFIKKQKEMQKEIADKNSTISDLSHKLGVSSNQYQSLLKENEKNSSLLAEENNKMNDKLKNEISEMHHRIEQSENEAKEKILSIKASSKKKQLKLVTALRNIQSKYEKSESEYFTKINELTKQLETAQKGEEEAVNEAKKLKDEVNELKSRISTLTVEQKMMNSRLASKDEKMKREKALFDSQLKLRLFAAESDSKAKMETLKNELNLKSQDFMTRICRTFKEMFYVNQPVNETTVEQILRNVRARLTMLEKDSFAAEEANHELQSIKQLLDQHHQQSGENHSKFVKVSTTVGEIIDKKKQLEEEVTSLQQQVKSFKKDVVDARAVLMQNTNNKEWEDWAKKLYSLISGGFNLVKTPNEIRNVIEEAIFAAIGNKIIWRRLDCLRAEKKLIIRGALRVKAKKGQPPSLTQLITIGIVVGRMQKMSGHFQSSLSLYREDAGTSANQQQLGLNQNKLKQLQSNNNNNINKKDTQKSFTNGPTSRAPLFSKFIVESPFSNTAKNDE